MHDLPEQLRGLGNDGWRAGLLSGQGGRSVAKCRRRPPGCTLSSCRANPDLLATPLQAAHEANVATNLGPKPSSFRLHGSEVLATPPPSNAQAAHEAIEPTHLAEAKFEEAQRLAQVSRLLQGSCERQCLPGSTWIAHCSRGQVVWPRLSADVRALSST